MKLLYKSLLFLIIFICSIGSVCAADNTTFDNVTGDGGLSPVNPPINNTTDVSNEPVGHIMTDKEKFEFMDGLYRNNTSLNKKVKALNEKIDKQGVEIKYLNDTLNLVLEDNKALKEDNKALKEDIKELNVKLDNLKLENDNLNKKMLELYDNLTKAKDKLIDKCFNLENKNKEQLNEIQQLNETIKNLTNEINRLKTINKDLEAKQVRYSDVHNAIKTLDTYIKKHKKAPDTVKCGGKSFKLNDFLKLELVKDGKERALLFKEKQGVLPNYTVVASYQLNLNIYKKLYNIKK